LTYRSVVYRPITITYFITLMLTTLLLFTLLTYTIPVFVKGLGIPVPIALLLFYLALMGSCINIPIKSYETYEPAIVIREVRIFGIKWILPAFDIGVRRTILAINVGGAIIPVLISLFLLTYTIPVHEENPASTYIKTLIALIAVTYFINKVARVVPGLGIAVPGFLPPIITAITSILLHAIPPKSNPAVIAYISGTLGTLIGADLMNLNKIIRIRARVVSIGGAGTFDGIYLTGLMASALTLLVI